ncbi:uncharacterized protein M421DRAFT_426787 [Didymella exigua CBS 183.55]|uniref:Uncharacterized protein n=1 Tax=Didymella exigua CBS 183.55 TaxID=1150837 RepID=A0A6A5R6B0_9PLEO|nr:uncharacterized protein M421DRAFT_426787 [Didymella exigua CBS 183.55]KAF1922544.1 hypothetical protein M421DRAFT_426787 [Didymella exigua CBS 183.55]
MATAEDSTAPKSSHVSDPALAPFLQSTFDPADYLNATLPSLSLSGRPVKSTSASLADLSSQTQDLLSQLNAQTTRLSAILTQLTDDILRSGGRLAYEVEVLRGETIGLTDILRDGLKEEIAKFLPGGLALETEPQETASRRPSDAPIQDDTAAESSQGTTQPPPADTTPEYITSLRTLTTVRSRLETVIKVFGEAMHWTIPPSDVSLGSSLISVSAPEPGSDNASLEQRGKEFASALRSEIADLVVGDPEQGPAKAQARIQALRDLAVVWKGTAEEKARGKFVEGLVKVAEDKQREVEKERERSKGRSGRSASTTKPQPPPVRGQGRGGFLENLSRIRGFVE